MEAGDATKPCAVSKTAPRTETAVPPNVDRAAGRKNGIQAGPSEICYGHWHAATEQRS